MTISESFKRFEYFNFAKKFLENENFFQKTGVQFFTWNHWDWKHIISIQNCSVKNQLMTNRIATTKWAYHKELSFASNYFIFFGIVFLVLESLKKS